MLADDIFRRELATVTQDLTQWAPTQRNVARVEVRDGHGYWSLSAYPITPGACAVTLVLRFDQHFDLALDGERFEDREVENYGIFPQMLEAIVEGRVERRRFLSAATAALVRQDMRILLPERVLHFETLKAGAIRTDDVVCKTQRFLPYAR